MSFSTVSMSIAEGPDVEEATADFVENVELKEFPGLTFLPKFDYPDILIKVYDLESGDLRQVLFSKYMEFPQVHFRDRLSTADINGDGVMDLQLMVTSGTQMTTLAGWTFDKRKRLFSQFSTEIEKAHRHSEY